MIDKSNQKLLKIAKNIALKAGQVVKQQENLRQKFSFDDENIKEMKAEMDIVIEKIIIEELMLTGLSILSEEKGCISGDRLDSRRWIIDPIDGTFNFVKKLGPCAISIGLWDKDLPVFGVVFSLNTSELFWGGKEFGSFCNEDRISVSSASNISFSSVCTGFPVRLNMIANDTASEFWRSVSSFSKVRMIGCASMSLVYVARGSAEAYFENQIMIWDVAAGIPLVEGAGGRVSIKSGSSHNALHVFAANKSIFTAARFE